ncbi:SapB/AmfS family lanthipeptide [Streptomyces sp. NBC_01190]|nr:SapB/AmfS family lanthipeptide [Streptomyces sp. NBC_01190]
MPEILELQELDTDFGPDEEGVIAESSLSGAACDSGYSIIVC